VSDLRKHLDDARREYRSQRYPGSLADELLATPRRRSLPWTLVATAVTGLAAALLVWLGLPPNHNGTKGTSNNSSVALVIEEQLEPPPTLSAALTTQPIYVEVAPPGQLVLPPVSDYIQLTPSNSEEMSVPAMPSMPGLNYASDSSSSTSSTSQEPA
jgi:hypothetical protein